MRSIVLTIPAAMFVISLLASPSGACIGSSVQCEVEDLQRKLDDDREKARRDADQMQRTLQDLQFSMDAMRARSEDALRDPAKRRHEDEMERRIDQWFKLPSSSELTVPPLGERRRSDTHNSDADQADKLKVAMILADPYWGRSIALPRWILKLDKEEPAGRVTRGFETSWFHCVDMLNRKKPKRLDTAQHLADCHEVYATRMKALGTGYDGDSDVQARLYRDINVRSN